ncbi:MAG: glycosyltransferase family 4 protein [Bacillota bacterium]|jgi:Glycosyltransferase
MMGGPLPLPVIYVLEATGLSGGVKNVLEQANRLYQRGVDVRVASLGARPRWFPLRVPFLRFRDYRALVGALKTVEAIKVATWWNTAQAVWESCDEAQGGRGIPVYLVQDIETSYYPDDAAMRKRVAETYRLPMACLTIAPWIATHLRAHYGREAIDVSIAVDHDVFFPQRDDSVDPRSILACARPRQRIKGFDVTLEAVRRVRESLADVSFVTYGLEPFQVAWIRHRHLLRPPDTTLARLYSNCGVFVQSSHHEGFGLPILEAMACGAPVVATRATGNETFCRDGWNCLLVERGRPDQLAAAIRRVLTDPELARTLAEGGRKTARFYTWPAVIDRLVAAFQRIARDRGLARACR